jgi:hypothetical protein
VFPVNNVPGAVVSLMDRTCSRMLWTAFASACGSSVAAPLVINFDTDPIGNPVEDGTVVDDLYSGLGVTFTHEGPTGCGTNV